MARVTAVERAAVRIEYRIAVVRVFSEEDQVGSAAGDWRFE
jgi:hypothetical protein